MGAHWSWAIETNRRQLDLLTHPSPKATRSTHEQRFEFREVPNSAASSLT